MSCVRNFPVECACPIAYAGWKGDGKTTVEEVEEYFGSILHRADGLMGEPAAVRWFLNTWDEEPREQIRPALLAEVVRELRRRDTDTCIHQEQGLCLDCASDRELDPQAWEQYGNHPAGLERLEALKKELAQRTPSGVRIADPEMPF